MTAIEAVAAALILINVWLVGLRSIWNYAFGIAGVIVYAWIFYHARLYSDTLLQGFFLLVQLFGWHNWTQSKRAFGEVLVLRMTSLERIGCVAAIAGATAAWGWLMHNFTDAAAPWLDAGVAMTSVAAQILLTQRRIENWWLWIAVNAMSVVLYASRGLYVTMALYCALLALSGWSLVAWHSAETARRQPRAEQNSANGN